MHTRMHAHMHNNVWRHAHEKKIIILSFSNFDNTRERNEKSKLGFCICGFFFISLFVCLFVCLFILFCCQHLETVGIHISVFGKCCVFTDRTFETQFMSYFVRVLLSCVMCVTLPEAKSCADGLFQEVLGRKDKADSTRNALSVLTKFRFLFHLPLNMQRNIQKVILLSDTDDSILALW